MLNIDIIKFAKKTRYHSITKSNRSVSTDSHYSKKSIDQEIFGSCYITIGLTLFPIVIIILRQNVDITISKDKKCCKVMILKKKRKKKALDQKRVVLEAAILLYTAREASIQEFAAVRSTTQAWDFNLLALVWVEQIIVPARIIGVNNIYSHSY